MAKRINFRAIAVRMGDDLKYDTSLSEIDRYASVTLNVQPKSQRSTGITSERAQRIYDWIVSLDKRQDLKDSTKASRLADFIQAFGIDPATYLGGTVPTRRPKVAEPKPAVAPNNVFLVHGHDHGSLETVARFLEKLGLDVTILHEKPNRGQTIIEKLERESDVDLAVVLLTPDDVGSTVDDQENLSPRARQNVVMELGLFIGKLGRDRTFALVKGAIEKPSDYHGVLYIPFGPKYPWKVALAKELKEAGANIDLNDAL